MKIENGKLKNRKRQRDAASRAVLLFQFSIFNYRDSDETPRAGSPRYPHDAYVSDRTIDSHIKRVRRKFEEADPAFDHIETVYGLGYRWKE